MTWLRRLTLETVIVHTKDGPSFRGVKQAVYSDCLVLRDAMLLEPEQQEILNGLTVIPREQVQFMQLVSA